MARSSKADIEFHSEGYGREAHAAVNVKLYQHGGWNEPATLPATVAADMGATEAEAEEFSAVWAALGDEQRQGWADLAIEDGWNRLTEEAREIFGRNAEVYAEGRSSGWAVVAPGYDRYTAADHFRAHHPFTRSEVESWNALAVSKWSRFDKACRETVADLPYQALSAFYLNRFEPDMAARETARRFAFYYDVPETFEREGGAA